MYCVHFNFLGIYISQISHICGFRARKFVDVDTVVFKYSRVK